MLKHLEPFIITAKAACYVGNGAPAPSSRPGSHDLVYADGPWSYRDSYVGGTDFSGQEIVWHERLPIWAMTYYGRILRSDLIDGEQAGTIIKNALSALYRESRFLGGFACDVGDYRYIDTNTGTFESFTGLERITREGVACYQLDYLGGMIKV
jgi:hypothetical protein